MRDFVLFRIELFLSAILFGMAVLSPRLYSFAYVLVAFVITIMGVGSFFLAWGKRGENFLQFEPIFAVVALIMGFTFPVFVYSFDDNTAYMFSWGLPYSLNYINKGACLTGMGILAFLSGSSFTSKSDRCIHHVRSRRIIKNRWLPVGLLFILICYIALGGFERFKTIYTEGESGGSYLTYIEVFIIAFSQVIISNEIWNKSHDRRYKVKFIPIAVVLFIALFFLYVGNRTYSLYLLLPLVVFLSSYRYKVKFRTFVFLIALGGAAMIAIMLFRSRSEINQDTGWYYYLVDLMIPNTATYLGCEVADARGFSFGASMLGSVLGAIPFSQSLLSMATGIGGETTNSSEIFTTYLGSQAGTGTNFVADSYLAFGSLGVFVVSFLGGWFLRLIKRRSGDSYYYLVMYVVCCGFAVYMVRSSFLYPIRFMLYSLIFANLNLKSQNDRFNHSSSI